MPCTFMAVTSSSLTVIPTTIIALSSPRFSEPTDIIGAYRRCYLLLHSDHHCFRFAAEADPQEAHHDLAIHALSRWAIPLMLLGITAWG